MAQPLIYAKPIAVTDERLKANLEKLEKQKLFREALDKQVKESKRLKASGLEAERRGFHMQMPSNKNAPATPQLQHTSPSSSTPEGGGPMAASPVTAKHMMSPVSEPMPVRYTFTFEGGKAQFSQETGTTGGGSARAIGSGAASHHHQHHPPQHPPTTQSRNPHRPGAKSGGGGGPSQTTSPANRSPQLSSASAVSGGGGGGELHESSSLPGNFSLSPPGLKPGRGQYESQSLPVDLVQHFSAMSNNSNGSPMNNCDGLSPSPALRSPQLQPRSSGGDRRHSDDHWRLAAVLSTSGDLVPESGAANTSPALGPLGMSGGGLASSRHEKTGAPKKQTARNLPPLEVETSGDLMGGRVVSSRSGADSPQRGRDKQPSRRRQPSSGAGAASSSGKGRMPTTGAVPRSPSSPDPQTMLDRQKEKSWEQQVKKLKEEMVRNKQRERGARGGRGSSPQAERSSQPQQVPRRAETAPETTNATDVAKRSDASLFPNRARYGNAGRRAPLSQANPDFSRARIFTADNFRRVESPPLEDVSILHEDVNDDGENDKEAAGRSPLFSSTAGTKRPHRRDSPSTGGHPEGQRRPLHGDDSDQLNSTIGSVLPTDEVTSVPIAKEHLAQFAEAQIITVQQANHLWKFFLSLCGAVEAVREEEDIVLGVESSLNMEDEREGGDAFASPDPAHQKKLSSSSSSAAASYSRKAHTTGGNRTGTNPPNARPAYRHGLEDDDDDEYEYEYEAEVAEDVVTEDVTVDIEEVLLVDTMDDDDNNEDEMLTTESHSRWNRNVIASGRDTTMNAPPITMTTSKPQKQKAVRSSLLDSNSTFDTTSKALPHHTTVKPSPPPPTVTSYTSLSPYSYHHVVDNDIVHDDGETYLLSESPDPEEVISTRKPVIFSESLRRKISQSRNHPTQQKSLPDDSDDILSMEEHFEPVPKLKKKKERIKRKASSIEELLGSSDDDITLE